MSNARYVFLDYARLLAALLVIYGHLYTYNLNNPIRTFIYEFHMPFFFGVSGMLHKYSGKIQIWKYFRTLIVPACFFAGTFFIYSSLFYQNGLFGYKGSIPQELVGDTLLDTFKNYLLFSIDGIKKGNFMPNGPCWFLIALFYCKVMMDCFNKQPVLCVLIWCILFYVLCICRNRYFFLANAVMAMPFYCCGFVARKFLSNLENIKYKLLIIAVAFVLVIVIMRINGNVSMWAIIFGKVRYLCVPLFYICGFLGSIMLLFLCLLIPQRQGAVERYADSLISILGLQMFFISAIDNVLGYNLGYLLSFLLALAVFIFCIGGHFFLQKTCPWAIGKYSMS